MRLSAELESCETSECHAVNRDRPGLGPSPVATQRCHFSGQGCRRHAASDSSERSDISRHVRGIPEVRAQDFAPRFYERLGFTPIANRGVYLLMEWRGDVNSQPPTSNSQGGRPNRLREMRKNELVGVTFTPLFERLSLGVGSWELEVDLLQDPESTTL